MARRRGRSAAPAWRVEASLVGTPDDGGERGLEESFFGGEYFSAAVS